MAQEIDVTDDQKRRFAEAWHRLGDVGMILAVREVFGGTEEDTARHWQLGMRLQADPEVLAHREEIRRSGSTAHLPTRADVGAAIWQRFQSVDADDRPVAHDTWIRAMRLYGEMMGFIQKPGAGGVESQSPTSFDWDNMPPDVLRELAKRRK